MSESISQRLHRSMIAAGYESIARYAKELGISKFTFYNYMRGREPPASVIAKVLERTRIAPDWLLLGVGPMNRPDPEEEATRISGANALSADTLYEAAARAQERELGEHVRRLIRVYRSGMEPARSKALWALDFADPGAARRVRVPLVGRIAAGTPLLATENVEAWLEVEDPHASGVLFALRVKGDSMTGANINDGDVVIVRQQDTANDGDIVVALVDGPEPEATVKRLGVEGPNVRLSPENPAHQPLVLPCDRVSVQGKVVGIHRNQA